MEVFISWSGKRSRAVAETLRGWLEEIFRDKVKPWMSTTDLGRGEWRKELGRHLTETQAGIVCVTPENFNPSWMLYEVGFLSRSVEGGYVVPYLINMDIGELKGPLEQFQARKALQEDTRKLVENINTALGDKRFDSGELNRYFESLWPKLEESIRKLPPPEIAVDIKNERNLSLREAIERTGLVDIEDRQEKKEMYRLPSLNFYEKAKREIVITGVSSKWTFETQTEMVREALKVGKGVYILILHPNALEVKSMVDKEEGQNIKLDIDIVISKIKHNSFHKDENFHIRFMETIPPFQGVMIDGDISAPEGSTPQDQDGQIRIQPRTQYGTTHESVILQFRKTMPSGDEPPGGFYYFARDLRQQWRFHGKEHPELFA